MRLDIRNGNHAGKLFLLETLQQSGDANTIVTLRCRDGASVRIHKVVLQKLCGNLKFEVDETAKNVDISEKTMSKIKDYMYSGEPMKLYNKEKIPILFGSDILGMKKLEKDMTEHLLDDKNWENIRGLYEELELTASERKYLEQFMARNKKSLPKSKGTRSAPSISVTTASNVVNEASLRTGRGITNESVGSSSQPIVIDSQCAREIAQSLSLESRATSLVARSMRQSAFPMIFVKRGPDDTLTFRKVTEDYKVRPKTFHYQPGCNMTSLIWKNCVIMKKKLLTIDIGRHSMLVFDLDTGSTSSKEIPAFGDACGLTVLDSCAFLWSGSFIYEIIWLHGNVELKKRGNSRIEIMRNLRVLRNESNKLTFAINDGSSKTAKLQYILCSENEAKCVEQSSSERSKWFLGSSEKDYFYIENGNLLAHANQNVIHHIYEREYFKDSFNVEHIVFLRTLVSESVSKVTVVDMSTGKAIHNFNIEGEIKLVQTVGS